MTHGLNFFFPLIFNIYINFVRPKRENNIKYILKEKKNKKIRGEKKIAEKVAEKHQG